MTEPPVYPGYGVLAKQDTPSWDPKTRAVIAARLATPQHPRFLTARQWTVANALCQRILPQASGDESMPLVALLDAKLLADHGDGFRQGDMPYMREAWQRGLVALDDEAMERDGCGFAEISAAQQDALLSAMQAGDIVSARWEGLHAKTFFERRVLVDVPALYYSLPKSWNEIGFGGPASPRGYVRLDGDRLDPWEAAAAIPGDGPHSERERHHAERENRHVV